VLVECAGRVWRADRDKTQDFKFAFNLKNTRSLYIVPIYYMPNGVSWQDEEVMVLPHSPGSIVVDTV